MKGIIVEGHITDQEGDTFCGECSTNLTNLIRDVFWQATPETVADHITNAISYDDFTRFVERMFVNYNDRKN